MRAAVTALGRTLRGWRPRTWYLTGRTVPIRRALLPLCDGFALAAAGLALVTAWQTAVYLAAVLIALNAAGQHRLRICLRISDEIPRLAASVTLVTVLVLPWIHPAARLAELALISVGLVLAVRASLYAALRAAHRRGWLIESALIVGTGPASAEVGQTLLEHPQLGLRPVGFIGSPPSAPGPPLPVLGGPSEMGAVAARRDIRQIIVCFPDGGDADLVTELRACRPSAAEVCVVPRMPELAAAIPAGNRDDVRGIPLIPLPPSGPRWPGRLVKRAFDLILGAALLLACAPLLSLLALAVLLYCGPPALFRQVRVTRAGALMKIAKLRTLTVQDPDAQWTVSHDQCTTLGRWLRSTHLDELPQLVNVIRGEMSLVGPRPERPYFTARFAKVIPRYDDRHRVRAGLTGWAQVHGLTGDTSVRERVRFDNFYIDHWSLWLDVTILARTLAEPLAGLLREGGPGSAGRPARRAGRGASTEGPAWRSGPGRSGPGHRFGGPEKSAAGERGAARPADPGEPDEPGQRVTSKARSMPG